MASGWRGMAVGALGLVTLETLVATNANSRVASLAGLPAQWAAKLIDPNVPALRLHAAAASSSSRSTTGATLGAVAGALPGAAVKAAGNVDGAIGGAIGGPAWQAVGQSLPGAVLSRLNPFG